VYTSTIAGAVRKMKERDQKCKFSTASPSLVPLSLTPFTWRGHRHPDLRRFPGIQSPLICPGDGRMLLREGHVPGRSSPGPEKAGGHLPHKVFRMLLTKGRITRGLIVMLSNWLHSEFQVFYRQRIFPQHETTMENRPGKLSGHPSRKKGCSISQNRPRVFAELKREARKRSSMLWSGWMPCVPTFRTGEANGPVLKLCNSIRANSLNGNTYSNLKPPDVYS
jgi:hypothetical protein